MLSGLPESEPEAVGEEIEEELRRFEGPDGFEGPCEMIVGAARMRTSETRLIHRAA
jgi:hypothetical protein